MTRTKVEPFRYAATKIHELKPGSAEWVKRMTASKIAAVVGHSPYDSPFSLWHKMAGSTPWQADNDVLRRGHYLEPSVRQWFRDQHPSWQVDRTGSWENIERPWQAATPDGIALKRNVERTPIALVQCKTSLLDWEWGEPGTDDVPPGYRDQCLWELDTLGLDRCYLAVLTSRFEFREYVIDRDDEAIAHLRTAARAFLDSLEQGQAPPLDGHDETYQTIRQLHPGIDDVDVEISRDLAADLIDSIIARDAAEADRKAALVQIADRLGSGRRAVVERRTIATRQARRDGVPYLVTARGLTSAPIERKTA